MTTAKSFRLALSSMLLAAVFCTISAPTQTAPDAATESLVAGNTAFAFDLYSRLRTGDDNLFFSPYSISTCLGMTYTGARGDTATQMGSVLHFDSDLTNFSASFAKLQAELARSQSKGGIELNLANGLWGQQEHPFQSEFLRIARKDFSAKVNQADFRTEAESARAQINDWVSDQTKGKIKDLLQRSAVNESTRLVLVNAIYFKGRWAKQFQKKDTRDEPFHVTSARDVQAPLMSVQKTFNYAETDGYQLLELPYKSGTLAMVVLLPKEIDGLNKLETSLDGKSLNEQISQAKEQEVEVHLPKFKLTSQFSLAETLAGMGMQIPFTGQADFSGMDGEHDLYISDVVHKAYVDLDEEGTEAAAATGTVMMAAAMRARDVCPVFRADHPFIFMIRDTQSGTILFLGRVTDPTK